MKKSILIIPSWYPSLDSPSGGTFFLEQSLIMSEDFHITILAMERNVCSITNFFRSFLFIKNPKKSNIHKLNTYYVSLPYCHKLSSKLNYLALKKAYNKAIKILCKQQTFRIDLIHAHAVFMGGVAAYELSKKLGVKYIITEHFSPFSLDFMHSIVWKQKMKTALEGCCKLLAVSNFMRQQLLMQNISCNPIVVGNFVNDNLFIIPQKECYTGKGVFKMLNVAYYPGFIKDLDNLFQALVLVRKKHQQIQMTIVGGGEPNGGYTSNNKIHLMVKRYNLEDIIIVVGSATRQEMSALMQECDVYVSSSIAESFGVCLCEAMLCGKPVVLTNNGGSNDFVTSENSILVDIHDPKQLSMGILEIMKNYSSYNSKTIRDSIKDKYGKNIFKKKLGEIYNDILNERE